MIANILRNQKDLALVTATVAILAILFTPVPPAALDLAIIINFALALTILLLTFYVAKPVEFSTFPSLLLVATLYRLSLNVAATRLILNHGSAGQVIGSIGAFAVQGNFVIGLVVFFILVVVQYVVVTSGAQRVSEVAARFTLDSMPGQQMSIDADLNMGLIDQKEAVRRREELEKEASFYGAMDGASKFVKGDAIAGIIILLINIIAGWIIGITQMGMDWSEALAQFTLLTIGDGISTQLPALIISIATGIIVTRSGSDKQLGAEVLRQLGSEPRIPLIVAAILLALLLLPGMPKWPIVIIATGTAIAWWRNRRQGAREADNDVPILDSASLASAEQPPVLQLRLGELLGESWGRDGAQILDRIATLRKAYEQELGIGFPAVQIADGHGLGGQEYEIRLFGARYGAAEIYPDQQLAVSGPGVKMRLNGIEAVDPAFGLPAVWIDPSRAGQAREAGYTLVDPLTVMITHFSEIVRGEAATLLTRSQAVALIDGLRERQPGLFEELVPNILSMADVQRVLQNLLAENVSIANLDIIIEHLTDVGRNQKDPAELTELVRQKLSYAICHKLRGQHSDLAVLSLDPRLENQIIGAARPGASGGMALDPRLAEQMLRKLAPLSDEMFRQGRAPVLLCGAELRRHLRGLTRRALPRLSILSISEIPFRIDLKSFDIVKLEG
ncbi:flagellar biosynthesis protein FlhA [Sphingosinithalassobacter portus]|uniref:flagellar biosynthesis protein FlhA n=1 Tax=Stakelama portus TaxID=2676234 RepID=UPI000D6E8762|nr:flagellar biosynthesis protein FlhA [Sphingosinithalassobacter portus]